jgi:signal transduction histidine kinase
VNQIFLKHFWISPRLLAFYAPLSLTAVPVALIQVDIQAADLVAIATIVTAVACALLAILIPIDRALRLTGITRVVFFTSFVMIVGAVRGAVLVSAAEFLEIDDPVDLGARVTNSILNTGFWVLILAGLLAMVRENIERYEQHFAEKTIEAASQIEASQDLVTHQIDSMPHLLLLKENLRRVLSNLDSSRFNERDLLLAATAIKSEVENSLRPFSHKIWFSEALTRPRLRGSGLWSEAISRPQFAPLTSALVLSVWFGIGALSVLSPTAAAVGALATGLCAFAIATAAKAIAKAAPPNLLMGLGLLGVSSALIYLGTVVAVIASESEQLTINVFVSGALFPAANFTVLMITSLALQIRATYRVIDGLLDSAASLANSRLRSQFASYLHNSLQAELSSLAIQLEKAAAGSGESDEVVRERLEELSRRSIGEDFASRALRPQDRLTKVAAAWQGIIEIRLLENPLSGIHESVLPIVVELIEESIANAVRHASAPWIEFKFEPEAQGCLATITSPGQSQGKDVESLGSSWLKANAKELSVADSPEGIRVTRVRI